MSNYWKATGMPGGDYHFTHTSGTTVLISGPGATMFVRNFALPAPPKEEPTITLSEAKATRASRVEGRDVFVREGRAQCRECGMIYSSDTEHPPGSVVCRTCDSVVNGILELVPGKKPSGRRCDHRKTPRRYVPRKTG